MYIPGSHCEKRTAAHRFFIIVRSCSAGRNPSTSRAPVLPGTTGPTSPASLLVYRWRRESSTSSPAQNNKLEDCFVRLIGTRTPCWPLTAMLCSYVGGIRVSGLFMCYTRLCSWGFPPSPPCSGVTMPNGWWHAAESTVLQAYATESPDTALILRIAV